MKSRLVYYLCSNTLLLSPRLFVRTMCAAIWSHLEHHFFPPCLQNKLRCEGIATGKWEGMCVTHEGRNKNCCGKVRWTPVITWHYLPDKLGSWTVQWIKGEPGYLTLMKIMMCTVTQQHTWTHKGKKDENHNDRVDHQSEVLPSSSSVCADNAPQLQEKKKIYC